MNAVNGATTDEQDAASGRRSSWAVAAVAVATVAALLALMRGVVLALAVAGQTSTWVVDVPVWPTSAMPPQAWDTPTASGFPSPVEGTADGVRLWLESTDALTAALAGAELWVGWLLLGVAVLVLLPLVRVAVEGRGLQSGHPGRVLVVAALAVAGWGAAYGFPVLAASRAVAAQDSGLPSAWFGPYFVAPWWPLAGAALLVLVALSMRQAARVAADSAGLV